MLSTLAFAALFPVASARHSAMALQSSTADASICSATVDDAAVIVLSVFPDATVDVIGTRPGEKVHESMISETDLCKTYDLGEVYCVLREDTSKFNKIVERHNGEKVNFTKYSSEIVDEFSKVDFLRKINNSMIFDV